MADSVSYENEAENGVYLVCFDLSTGAVLSVQPTQKTEDLPAR